MTMSWLMPLGSWGEWVGGLATGAAFLIAALAYRREQRHRVMEQAEMIYVEGSAFDRSAPGARAPHCFVYNDSDRPIYDAYVDLTIDGSLQGRFFIEHLRPKSSVEVPIGVEPTESTPTFVLVALGFIDAGNRSWRRIGSGELESMRVAVPWWYRFLPMFVKRRIPGDAGSL